MNYGLIEDDIVARLSALKDTQDGLVVLACPEVESEFKVPFKDIRITVSYSQSDFVGNRNSNDMPSMATDAVVQNEMIEIAIEIQSRKLRGEVGVYTIYERVRLLLLGYRPLGEYMDAIKFKSFKLDDYSASIWTAILVVTTACRVVSNFDDDESGLPLVTSITTEDNYIS